MLILNRLTTSQKTIVGSSLKMPYIKVLYGYKKNPGKGKPPGIQTIHRKARLENKNFSPLVFQVL